MTDEHPSPVDRLRVGFATAVDGLNDGIVKAVVVVAITSAGRGCKIWDYGDVPACARVGEAIRGALYMPDIVDASNLNRGIPHSMRSDLLQPTESLPEVSASSTPVQGP